jgi:hypothetical protein
VTFKTPRSLLLLAALAARACFSPVLSAQETAVLTLPNLLPEAPQPHLDHEAVVEAELQTSSSQQPVPATQNAAQAPMTDAEKKQAAEAESLRELHQRLAGVVPNFNAVMGGDALPLSPRQKIRAAFRSAIDPYQFGLALITSGYGQATDSHSSIDADGLRHGYGQGAAGFGKRYGASFTDQFDGTMIGNGFLPVLLHQDPRYYRMGTGTFKKRFLYSLSTTVRCKGDNGKWQPSYSNILGNIAAGGISNLYYPKADRGFGLTMEQGLTVTAEGAFGALLIEFYPDIRKHIHKKQPDATSLPAQQ